MADDEAQRIRDRMKRRQQRLLGEQATRMEMVGGSAEDIEPPTQPVDPQRLQRQKSQPTMRILQDPVAYVHFQNVMRGINFFILFPLAIWCAALGRNQSIQCWSDALDHPYASLVEGAPSFLKRSGFSQFLLVEATFGFIIHHDAILETFLRRRSNQAPGLLAAMGIEKWANWLQALLGTAAFIVWVAKDFCLYIVLYELAYIAFSLFGR